MNEKRRRVALNGFLRPTICKACGGILIYKGLGEYQCEDCNACEYDDYGKVRSYLEKHRGANVAEISAQTGVSHKAIRDMIKENRFEPVESKGGYLRCEIYGENIRRGRFCTKCEAAYHRQIEEAHQQRKNYKRMSGFGGEKLEVRAGGSVLKDSKRYRKVQDNYEKRDSWICSCNYGFWTFCHSQSCSNGNRNGWNSENQRESRYRQLGSGINFKGCQD